MADIFHTCLYCFGRAEVIDKFGELCCRACDVKFTANEDRRKTTDGDKD